MRTSFEGKLRYARLESSPFLLQLLSTLPNDPELKALKKTIKTLQHKIEESRAVHPEVEFTVDADLEAIDDEDNSESDDEEGDDDDEEGDDLESDDDLADIADVDE